MYSLMGAVGTPAAVQVLIEVSKELPAYKHFVIFGSLTSNLKSADALKLLLVSILHLIYNYFLYIIIVY